MACHCNSYSDVFTLPSTEYSGAVVHWSSSHGHNVAFQQTNNKAILGKNETSHITHRWKTGRSQQVALKLLGNKERGRTLRSSNKNLQVEYWTWNRSWEHEIRMHRKPTYKHRKPARFWSFVDNGTTPLFGGNDQARKVFCFLGMRSLFFLIVLTTMSTGISGMNFDFILLRFLPKEEDFVVLDWQKLFISMGLHFLLILDWSWWPFMHVLLCVFSWRVLPHRQNTGGFFIVAIRKVACLPWMKATEVASETKVLQYVR